MADHHPRDTVLAWWASHHRHTAAQVAAFFNGPGRDQLPAGADTLKAATLRQWKARHGLPPTDAALDMADTPAASESGPAAPARGTSDAQDESTQPAAVWVDVHSVVPWADNPRDNDQAVPAVAQSIARFGYGRAFVGWRPDAGRMLVVGHTARKAVLLLLQRRPVYPFQAQAPADGAPPECMGCGQLVDGRHADGCRYLTPPGAPAPHLIPMRWRPDWSDAEARAYAIADNQLATLAGWVDTMLAAQLRDLAQHDSLGHQLLGWSGTELDSLLAELEGGGDKGTGKGTGKGDGGASLAERFGVPPFSLLDARQGYWRDRKRQWLALGIQSEVGRDGLGTTSNASDGVVDYMTGRGSTGDAGSVFDPVLMELACRWFAPRHGAVLDPFAGGSVRGVVSACLGHPYTGVDLRDEQVQANRVQWDRISAEIGATDARPGTVGPLPTTVPDLLVGFRPVQVSDAPTWWPYLQGFARTRRWPRYYASALWLASEGRKFLWGVVGGCLVVVKRSTIFRSRVLYLILPPMHPDGDLDAERAVVEAFRAAGVSTKLSTEDMALLGYGPDDATPDQGNAEFVYRLGDYDDLAGKPWRKWRGVRNDLQRLQVTTWDGTACAPDADLAAAEAVAVAWAGARQGASSKHVAQVLRMAGEATGDTCPARLALVRAADGHPLVALASQRTGPTWAVLLSGVQDYGRDDQLGDFNVAGHLVDVAHYRPLLGPDGLVNVGAGGQRGRGLVDAKRRLRPAHELQLHDLQVQAAFTEADWQAAHPDKLGASPVSGLAGRELPAPTWLCGDSTQLDDLLPDGQLYDLVATCPPYADLEVYSDDPRDISGMSWDAFCAAYRAILAAAVARLRPNRFAVVVVGDLRDKAGRYRGLVRVTEQALEDAGAHLYNVAIYVTPAGTLPIRAAPAFRASRKLGKTHQDVIVAFKGDPSTIRDALGEVPEWLAPDADEAKES